MGTSSSRSGPSDKPSLLPSWALPGGSEDQSLPDTSEDSSPEDSTNQENAEDNSGEPRTTEPSSPPSPRRWQAAKGRLTSISRGSGGRGLRSAGRSYVRAKGGGRSAASTASAGKSSVSRVGSFVAEVARSGINGALRAFDLASFVGKSAEETFAAIADALAPEGALVEDAAARAAVAETLALLYDKVVAAGGELTVLDSLTADDLKAAMESCITTYIYGRWVGELGLSIERGAVSETRAVELEQQMRSYIMESVKLEFQNVDAIRIDWSKREGRTLIDKVFQDAYSFLEKNQ